MNVTPPNSGSSGVSGHLYFLPSSLRFPPLPHSGLQIHPDVTSVRGNIWEPPTPSHSHGCMPTLPSHGARRMRKGCSTTEEKSGTARGMCIAHSAHRRPELGPSGAASCHLPSLQSVQSVNCTSKRGNNYVVEQSRPHPHTLVTNKQWSNIRQTPSP